MQLKNGHFSVFQGDGHANAAGGRVDFGHALLSWLGETEKWLEDVGPWAEFVWLTTL